jgi:hypothetical protein
MYKTHWTDTDTFRLPRIPLLLREFRVSAPLKTYWAGADPYSLAPCPALTPLVRLSEGVFLPPREGAVIRGKCKVRVRVRMLDESALSMRRVTFILYAAYQGRSGSLFHSVDAEARDGFAEAELTLYPPPFYEGDAENVAYFFKAVHMRGEREIESERITPSM